MKVTLLELQNSQNCTEAIVQRCYVKKVFLEISQNSQENTCARVSFLIKLAQVFSCEFCEISKNTFFQRTPLVATSDSMSFVNKLILKKYLKIVRLVKFGI